MLRLCLSLCLLLSTLDATTVLITGANRGLGLEFARQYAAKGYTVIGTARKPDEATELNALGVRVEQLDVTSNDSAQALAQRLDGVSIDLLINNAGIMRGRFAKLADLSFDEVSLTFEVNSVGPLRVTQVLLPNLRAGKGKTIVGISSQLGSIENNSGGMYAYRASKAALNQLNRTMALELRSEGFTCVVLHPGWVRTDMGGPQATFSPKESVSRMIRVIDGFDSTSSGRFFNLNGLELPW